MTLGEPPNIEVQVDKLSVTSNGRPLITRSRALLVFVCLLVRQRRKQPNAPWMSIEDLRAALPSVHGRQMQRFVDALSAITFPIAYESKTRGRYWLAVPAEAVRFDVDANRLDAFIGARGNLNSLATPPYLTQLNSTQLNSTQLNSTQLNSTQLAAGQRLESGKPKRAIALCATQAESG